MSLHFPNPRYRIYGAPLQFLNVAWGIVAGRRRPGSAVSELEGAVGVFLGVPHAVAMPQARVALYTSLRVLLRATARKRVILSPYTIHDVINMVVCAGGEPVFADVRDDANIDPDAIEALTDEHTAAVLITHLHGLACDVERIAAWCGSHNIPLIEDCAQAFGTTVGGRRVGSFGTVGVYSFGMAKNVNSYFGGMAVTSDARVAEALRTDMARLPEFDTGALLHRAAFCLAGQVMTTRPVFWSSAYWLFRYGFLHDVDALNNQWRGEMDPRLKEQIPEGYLRRMTPAQARVVLAQIRQVDADTAVRIGYAERYAEGLGDIPEVLCPPRRTDGSHIYLTYPIQVADRHALNRYLMRECQDVTIQHLTNTADADCYQPWSRECPVARRVAASVLLLPTYPSYGARDVDRNIALIRRYYGR